MLAVGAVGGVGRYQVEREIINGSDSVLGR